jgi:hypothetical protein
MSIAVFTQRLPPQFTKLTGQVTVPMQLPPVHFSPGRQATPQLPQFATSVIVRTQSTPQSVSPPLQAAPMQLPPAQRWPAEQTLPQAPQFAASTCTLAHKPPQSVWPPGHMATQPPPKQTWPLMQAVPQAPQLAGSL